jgi:hypothetical protein
MQSPLPNRVHYHNHGQAINSKRSREIARAARVIAPNQALLSEECRERIKHSKTGTANLQSSQSVEALVDDGDVDVLEPPVSSSLE